MTKYELLQEVKGQLKEWAIEIRSLKATRKQDKRGGRSLDDIENDIRKLKFKFRHHHIAYCEMRGRTREQIEQPAEGNYPDQYTVTNIKKEWSKKIDEDVCIGA